MLKVYKRTVKACWEWREENQICLFTVKIVDKFADKIQQKASSFSLCLEALFPGGQETGAVAGYIIFHYENVLTRLG